MGGGITAAPELRRVADELVARGWFKDTTELVDEAVRRFLETHTASLLDQFMKDDIEWGLRGND